MSLSSFKDDNLGMVRNISQLHAALFHKKLFLGMSTNIHPVLIKDLCIKKKDLLNAYVYIHC